MAHDTLGFLLAVSASQRQMPKADRLTVAKAMSTRSHQLEKELAKYAQVGPDEWRERVIEAAYKVLGQERIERPSIRCVACGLTSYNSNDIAHKFCGRCHRFHETPTDYEIRPKEENAMRHPTHTYTLVTLEVLPSTFEDIKSRLVAANYEHTIHPQTGEIDMTGIALAPLQAPEDAEPETITVLTAALTPDVIERMEAFVDANSQRVEQQVIVIDMEVSDPPADDKP